MPCIESLKAFNLFSLSDRELKGDLIIVFKSGVGSYLDWSAT